MKEKTWVATARKGGATITAEIAAAERPAEKDFAGDLLRQAEALRDVPLLDQIAGATRLEKLHRHGYQIESVIAVEE